MLKRPPAPVRWFVLLSALALLGTAVCAKSEHASEPEASPSAPAQVPATEVEKENEADAGMAAEAAQQAEQPQPPASKAPNSKNAPNNKNENPEPEFFPASKAAGDIF